MVKSWLVQDQTILGKDYSNLLIADSLLKTIWFINAPCYGNEALASPKANGVCKINRTIPLPMTHFLAVVANVILRWVLFSIKGVHTSEHKSITFIVSIIIAFHSSSTGLLRNLAVGGRGIDFIAVGDQSGCVLLISAATHARWGQDIDVPDMMLNVA
ncbi:hypothetical protein Tco_0461952 [Tanacetum coccineum]